MREGGLKSVLPTSSKGWRTFADVVALALGINVWLSVVLLPSLFIGTWSSPVNALPLVVLIAGLWRRSEVLLLLLYPSALLVPVALFPELASSQVYGPARFTIVSVGVVAFLLGISFFNSFYEPEPPVSVRPLASSRKPQPVRWRRRYRMYWTLTGLSVVFPATMLYAANFDPSIQAFMRQMYPGRVSEMLAVGNLAIVVAWVMIYRRYFTGPLRDHRTGDPELVRRMARVHVDLERKRPRPAFFVGVVFALGFMTLFLLTRYS
ncbi:hypothetical protein [Haliangium ochraceum]|uniref:Uncharacterized protein n=1 Tax=Haliangium ochraceum (strain DSM 14365 / JCM 11303 / SMP-2) TaxID=502025 RepID=D0LJ69_HALO1|nr:hypothetical protein [Haliangium ochraceum]ACY14916.1 hypothetical protein Hoch_2379 [Haliangium ochraceum DSM 14365]